LTVHRVVVEFLDHRNRWVCEKGPWHVAQRDAEHWAGIFRDLGYKAHLEKMHGSISGGGDDRSPHGALSSMA
jgi:hypothetical protein